MNQPIKYKFRYRPSYGSESLLLEFVNGVESTAFEKVLFDALRILNPRIIESEGIWINDEILYTIDSDLGQFTLSKDSWGFGFLMAEDNQECLLQIDNLLLKDERFEKLEVDFNEYK